MKKCGASLTFYIGITLSFLFLFLCLGSLAHELSAMTTAYLAAKESCQPINEYDYVLNKDGSISVTLHALKLKKGPKP